MNKTLYSLALASLLALGACSSEDVFNGGNSNANGEPFTLTLTLDRSNAVTRTTLEENETAGLTSRWAKDDKIYVYDSNGDQAGVLTLHDGSIGEVKGVFSGPCTGTTGDYSLIYYDADNTCFGEAVSGQAGKVLTFDNANHPYYSAPEELASMELLTIKDPDEYDLIRIEVKEGVGAVTKDIKLEAKLSMARFSLNNLPDGTGTLKIYNAAQEDGKIHSYAEYAKNNGKRHHWEAREGGITINGVDPSKDVFVAFVPEKYKLTFRFTTSKGEEYEANFNNATTLLPGVYYNAGFGSDNNTVQGADVNFTRVLTEPGGDDDVVGPIFEVGGKKFRFTRANLQFNTITKEYSIPEKQTEFIVKSGTRIGTTNTATNNPEIIGLFRWGATGIDDNVWLPWPADYWRDKQYYQSTTTINGTLPSQNSSVNATMNTNSTLCPGGKSQDTPYDWGKAYSMQKEDGSHYFTLSMAELTSVIDANLAVCGTVDNVGGVVILPYSDINEAKKAIEDVGGSHNALYKLSKTSANTGPNYGVDVTRYAYDRLTLTYDQLTKLNGVFLPASGMNNPSTGASNKPVVSSDYDDNICHYWTSTVAGTPSAYQFLVDGGTTQGSRYFKFMTYGKGYALAVRLVKEIKENTSTDDTVGEDINK